MNTGIINNNTSLLSEVKQQQSCELKIIISFLISLSHQLTSAKIILSKTWICYHLSSLAKTISCLKYVFCKFLFIKRIIQSSYKTLTNLKVNYVFHLNPFPDDTA